MQRNQTGKLKKIKRTLNSRWRRFWLSKGEAREVGATVSGVVRGVWKWFFRSLGRTIAIALGVAVAAFGVLSKVWAGEWFIQLPEPETQGLEILKFILTTLGGAGAVMYLVIRFRERSSAERVEEREQRSAGDKALAEATKLLGDHAASTSIAGVYALADVADTYPSSHVQRVVDILCGYLRTPRKDDNAVESTILQVLAEHYRSRDLDLFTKIHSRPSLRDPEVHANARKGLWSDARIDLHGATLRETVDFTSCFFIGTVNCDDVTFERRPVWKESTFHNTVSFNRAKFYEGSDFTYCTFNAQASFNNSQPSSDMNFMRSDFEDTFTGIDLVTGHDERGFNELQWNIKMSNFSGNLFLDMEYDPSEEVGRIYFRYSQVVFVGAIKVYIDGKNYTQANPPKETTWITSIE